MYINKAEDGRNNISGKKVAMFRKNLEPYVSQKAFAGMLIKNGLQIDKNAVQRIEIGKRFVTDIELKVIAKTLGVKYEDLLD